ncbi:MAG: hypothetical protein ACXWPS_03775 [Ktedonobacteraceae bacterium]
MKIFQDIPSASGEITLQKAIPAILERAQDLRLLSRKWSLVELQLDDDDFVWLREWASNLSRKTALTCLEERPWQQLPAGNRACTYSTAIGVLLLLFTTETARRKATEGILWPIFKDDCFLTSTTRALFTGGHPNRTHKDALEEAARWLNLRHVFGIEGLQNWFDTVYLQFGFTYQGFIRRLPEWLVGQGGTQAIQQLLDGPMKSDTFRMLWDALRNFRRKNIKVEQMKARLADNPWILPEWIDELLKQSTARIELGDGAETASINASKNDEPFVTEPILRWDPPKNPQFLCYVSNIAQFELSEPIYYVMINGQVYTQLERNADGVYTLSPSEEITLPATHPILIVTLISSTGQIISSQSLTLWDTYDGISVFRASSGKRIDAWQDMMRPELAYFIVTIADVTVVPQPSYWYRLDPLGTTLSMLVAGWPSLVSAELEGQLYWQPNSNYLPKREEPRWAKTIDISLYNTSNQVYFGDEVQATVRHPSDTSISFIRLGSKPIDFTDEDGETAFTESIAITPDMLFHGSHLAELDFTIGVRKDASLIRITRALSIEVIGAAMLTAQGWIALGPEMAFTVEQAKTFPVQIFRSHIKQWALLEGDSWIGRPQLTPRSIGSLAGLGAPIRLRRGPYNAIEPDIPLVCEVMNRGIIADTVQRNELDATTYNLHLTYPVELDEQHEVVIWDEIGQLHIGNPDFMLVQQRHSTTWVLELPETAARPLIIAIAYQGVRLGAWWDSNWTYMLLQQTQDVKTKATMLRWFQLPILSDHSRAQVRQFVERFGRTILPIWLSDAPLQDNLRWTDTDDQWLTSVRTLFSRWKPNEMSARQLVTQLGGTDENLVELIFRTAWRLLRVDPLLMGKVIQPFVLNVYLPQFGPSETRKLFRNLLSMLAEVANENDLYQKKTDLMKAISDTMGYVDLNFIRRGLLDPALSAFSSKGIEPIQENNLALALSIEPFRRLLAMSVLERIEQSLTSRR